MKSRSTYLPAFIACLVLTGCAHNPSLNVLGSYFPGWVFCVFLASLLTVLVRFLLRHFGGEHQLAPLVVIYPSMAIVFCLTLWLIFFGAR
jgi:hypothetical protein